MSADEGTTFITNVTNRQMKDAERYLQNYAAVWLDTAMTDDDGVLGLCVGTLSTIQQIHKFKDGETCLNYLRSVNDKPTFLRLSCEIDDQLLNDFLRLPQLGTFGSVFFGTRTRTQTRKMINL